MARKYTSTTIYVKRLFNAEYNIEYEKKNFICKSCIFISWCLTRYVSIYLSYMDIKHVIEKGEQIKCTDMKLRNDM